MSVGSVLAVVLGVGVGVVVETVVVEPTVEDLGLELVSLISFALPLVLGETAIVVR